MLSGGLPSPLPSVVCRQAAHTLLATCPTSLQATIEWESQDDGFIAQILVPEGTSGISVGTPVLVITESKGDVPAFAAFTAADAGGTAAPKVEAAAPAAAAPAPPAAPSAAPAAAAPQPAVQAAAPGGRVIASPYARKLAAQAGVSLAGAPGSGPGGRIVAADVQQLIASGGAAPTAAVGAAPEAAYAYATYTDIPNSQIRKVRLCGGTMPSAVREYEAGGSDMSVAMYYTPARLPLRSA